MLNTTNAIGSQQATEFCNPSNQGYTPLGVHSKKDVSKCLNKLEQDVEPAAKALAVSEPMAIFHPGDGKS